ncbi:MAG: hypothetical protein WCP93_00675 [Candidatus Berkelbacteria bacterium]
MNITKKVSLTLTKNWWHEINNNENITNLSKSKLISAINSFTSYNEPPTLTAELKKDEFEKIMSEISDVTFSGKPLFIVCENHENVSRIRITDEKSPNWDESIWIPGNDCNEGLPKPSEKSIYLIRTRHNNIYYAKVRKTNDKKEDDKWITLEGKVINPKIVTGWFHLC